MSAIAFAAAPSAPETTVCVSAGRIMLLVGAAFGSANLVQWAVLDGAMGWHPAVLAVSWPLAVGAVLIALFRLRRSGGPAGLKVASWSRLAVLAHIAAALALAAGSFAADDWSLMRWSGAISPALYAVAWAIAAAHQRNANMAALAVTAAAGVIALAARLGTPDQYLISACTLTLVTLLPGLWLALGRRL